MEDALALLILLRSAAPARALRLLLERHGCPSPALAAGPVAWRQAGVDEKHFALLRRPDTAHVEVDLRWLAAANHHLVGWHSPDYPALLRAITSPPAALFIAGDPELLWHPQVAVVGSRKPSLGGSEIAYDFARTLSKTGLAITSGLAEGIDTSAHLGALEHGSTLAVMATGPDRLYPASNARLMNAIVENGALVSEHPPGTPALREHFPSRNRLIAGLALGTVVIEAAERSGALITARLAAEFGREVFAVPGSIRNPMSRGCHRLIRQGASLIEGPEEIIEALAPMARELASSLRGRLQAAEPSLIAVPPGQALALPLDHGQAQIWQALESDRLALDQLSQRTGLTVAALSAMLLAMELDGVVSLVEGRYSRASGLSPARRRSAQATG